MSACYIRIHILATEAPEVNDPNLPQAQPSNGLHRPFLPCESFLVELIPVTILYADTAIAVK
jgi:hypothetical protein